MSRSNEIKRLMTNHNRRLQKLKETAAVHGLDVSPSIPLEIEDIEAKIAELQAELENISDDSQNFDADVQTIAAYNNQRLKDIKKHIEDHLELLREYEQREMLENDPRELKAIQFNIAKYKKSYEKYFEEAIALEAASPQLNNPAADVIQQDMDIMIQKLDDLQEKILKSNTIQLEIQTQLKTNMQQESPNQDDIVDSYVERLLDQYNNLDLPTVSHNRPFKARPMMSDLYIPLRLDIQVLKVEMDEESSFDEFDHPSQETNVLNSNEISTSHLGASFEQSSIMEIKRQQTIGQILDEHERICILGKPGSGKSTLVRWLVQALLLRWLEREVETDTEAVPKKNWLPVIIRCRELKKESSTWLLSELINHALLTHGIYEKTILDPLCKELTKRFTDGQVLLIIDGMDEIDGDWRLAFCSKLREIARSCKQGQILLTLRSLSYEAVQSYLEWDFEYAEMNNLTHKDKVRFVERWCTAVIRNEKLRNIMKTNLFKTIANKKLDHLTNIPLTLSALTLVAHNQNGKLPQKHSQIYDKYIDILLKQNAEHHPEVSWDEAVPQLECLAHAMCEAKILEISRNRIEELLDEMHQTYPNGRFIVKDKNGERRLPHQFLKALFEQTTLLMETGFKRQNNREVPTYQFNHRFIQEYLAGRSLIEGYVMENGRPTAPVERIASLMTKIDKITVKLSTDKHITETVVITDWHEPLKHCIEVSDNAQDILVAILTVLKDEDPLKMARPRAVMASHCLAQVNTSSPELNSVAHQVISSLIDQIQEEDAYSGDIPKTSLDNAIIALKTSIWGDLLRDMLLDKLVSSELSIIDRVPLSNVYTLANEYPLPEDDFEKWEIWLLKLANDLRNQDDKEAVGTALLISQNAFRNRVNFDYDIHSILFDQLDRSIPVVSAVTWALAWIIEKYRDNFVTWQTQPDQFRALTRYLEDQRSDKLIVRHILSMLPDLLMTTPLNRWSIVKGEIIQRETLPIQNGAMTNQLINTIAEWLNDKEEKVRTSAALTLGRLGISDIRAADALLEVVDKDQVSRKNRTQATQFLGCLDDQKVINELLNRLAANNIKTRRSARYALAGIGSDVVVSSAIERLAVTNEETKREIVLILEMIDNPKIASILEELKQDPTVGKIIKEKIGWFNGEEIERIWQVHTVDLDDFLVVTLIKGDTSLGKRAFVYISSLFDETLDIIEGLMEKKPINPTQNGGVILATSFGEPEKAIETRMGLEYRFSSTQIRFEIGSNSKKTNPFTSQSTKSSQTNEDKKVDDQSKKDFILNKIDYIRIGSGYMKAPVNKQSMIIFHRFASQINAIYDPDQTKNELKVVDNMGRPVNFDQL